MTTTDINNNTPWLDLKRILIPGEVYEVRIPKYKGKSTCSGYFDDSEKLVQAVGDYDGKAVGIYFTLNPCNPALLSRADNRMNEYAKNTTSDNDINKLTRILIDVDVVRPAGISSTDLEHEIALDKAKQIRNLLATEYNINSLLANSGNGAHVIPIIDLPNTQENVTLCKQFIEAIGYLFDSDQIKIDRTTYNPAHITKLYGTMVCKGDCTAERPHHRSALLEVPQDLTAAPIEILQHIASMAPDPTTKTKQHKQPEDILTSLNAEHWLNEHNIPISHDAPYSGGTKYILDSCPMDETHEHDQAAVVIQFPNGAIAFKCRHDRCRHYTWRDLREKFEPLMERTKSNNLKDTPDLDDINEGEEKESRKNQADILIEAAKDAQLFHDEQKEPCAVMRINGHDELYRIREKSFKHWLVQQFYEKTDQAPKSDSLKQALNLLEARAIFDGPQHSLNLRVARIKDTFYYDLANDQWASVKVTPEGWTVLNAPFIFRRSQNTAAQAIPCKGGELNQLLDYINLLNSNDQILILVYMVICLIPGIPHPVPVFAGEKGAAKSTAMRVLRKLIDPAIEELLSLPNDPGAIALLLSKNYAPYFDNLDGLTAAQSDILCRAVTGGGISKRKLYSDDEEIILKFQRCVALNGINPAATRPDLLDRSLLFTLQRISPDTRMTESEFWDSFEKARPMIFGAMLDVLCKAMAIYPTIKLSKLPRMADFCVWGYAVAEAAGIGGQCFLDAYDANIALQNESAIQSHPVASAVLALMDIKPNWFGTPVELLSMLEKVAAGQRINIKSQTWPKAANVLTRRLKEVESNLLAIGIKFEETKTNDAKRTRRITLSKTFSSLSSEPSISSESLIYKASQVDDLRTGFDNSDNIVHKPSRYKPSDNGGLGNLDDMDDFFPDCTENDWDDISKYAEEENYND